MTSPSSSRVVAAALAVVFVLAVLVGIAWYMGLMAVSEPAPPPSPPPACAVPPC